MDKIKILIVEDSPNIQMLYKKGLPDDVFEKKFCSDGREALAFYNEWNPDIIILDVMLPGISGYVVLKEIRQNIGDKKTVIIISTVLHGKDDVVSFMKLGIQGYIVKPFRVTEIGNTILKYYENIHPDRARNAQNNYNAVMDEIRKSYLTDKTKNDEKSITEEKEYLEIPSDFAQNEFAGQLTAEGLCLAIKSDEYGISLKIENNNLDALNELLQIPDFFDKVTTKKKDIHLSIAIKKLIMITDPHRKTSFAELNPDTQKRVKRLNRFLLEIVYSGITPKLKLEIAPKN